MPVMGITVDPLFAEAPLASPRIPLLKMGVPSWAVVSRILWHAGYSPRIENYRAAKRRAAQAADILIAATLAVSGVAMAPLPVLTVVEALAAALALALVLDLLKVPIFARLRIA